MSRTASWGLLPLMTLLLATLLVMPTSATHRDPDAPHDLVLRLSGGMPTADPASGAVLLDWRQGEFASWRIDVNEYTIVEVVVDAWFDVERPRQVVPELDDSGQHPDEEHLEPHLFAELKARDVHEVDGPARVVSINGTGNDFVYRVGLPGSGPVVFSLRRDVTPPVFEVGEPSNIEHFRFLLESSTDEPAYGDLRITPEGGEEVPFPTPNLAFRQTYPVQGLDADTVHTYYLLFEDWAGNQARSENMSVRTPARPFALEPVISDLVPAPNSTVSGNIVISANFTSPDSPVAAGGVRLFVDKTELTGGFSVIGNQVRWDPGAPMEPGLHAASVEVRNVAGGVGVARWTFTVADDNEAPGLGVALLALVVVAVAASRRS